MAVQNTTYSQIKWSLADLFPGHDTNEMKTTISEVESKVTELESKREYLTDDIAPETFMDLVKQVEDIIRLSNRIQSYAELWFTENTQNQNAQNFLAQIDQFTAELQNRLLFVSLWWKELDNQQAERLIAVAGDYRYWLEEMRHFKPHTLTEPEEKIINIKNVTGVSALQTLYSTITNRYVFKVTVDGEEKELTRDSLMVYARSHDPELRAAAYQELYRVYGNDDSVLGQMYQTVVRDWLNEQVKLRKFASPMAVRNLLNDIPDQVVDTLLDVARKNAGIFQRFFKLKARWLKMERLRRYDIYAPVVESDKRYEFNQAVDIVLDSFNHFHPRIGELAERVFAEKHLDSEVRPGKQGGAFCYSVAPEVTPWVLINYQSRPDDVATMAHELGHAIHAMMASDHTMFTFHSSLPLAETASTFGEMMLIDRLLKDERDENVRRDLIFMQVDDAYATIMRQAFFALFERQAHDMIRKGASIDELANAYMENLKEQFGDAVDLSEEFRWEWMSIPHIYRTPFYVYAYSFGQLLVFSLYQQYQQEGEAFKPRYLKILSAGGSDAPVRILDEAGIDVHSAEFWQGGFDVIDDLIKQLEAIPVA